MKCVIMQPYFFPYLGYYQLAYTADKFVFFDDVQFTRKSYLTRNSILVQNQSHQFSIPVSVPNRFSTINDVELHVNEFPKWCKKILGSIQNSYSKAPFFDETFNLIKTILFNSGASLSELNQNSITKTFEFLDIPFEHLRASELDYERDSNGQGKILSILKLLKANTYINPPGGKHLYDAEIFKSNDVDLKFLDPKLREYSQGNTKFISHLSILDMLMFLEKKDVVERLSESRLT